MMSSLSRYFNDALAYVRASFPVVHHFRADLNELPRGTILGASVWSARGQARWILERSVVFKEDVTYQDLSRAWLRANVDLPIRRKKADKPHLWAPVPLRSLPGTYEDVSYVDISGAYRSIIDRAGWNVEYRAMDWLGAGDARKDLDCLPKISYASLVALSANPFRISRVWNGKSISSRNTRNNYANVCLYALARDLLHAIYTDVCAEVNVLYANTDGYIVRNSDVARVQEIIARWNFASKIKKTGAVTISGTGSYAWDGAQPRRLATRSTLTPAADRAFVRWLHSRWTAIR